MTTNGNVHLENVLHLPAQQPMQVAIDALKAIALQASAAVNKLDGLFAPAGPAPRPMPASAPTPDAQEIEALLKVVPAAAAEQLKTWRVQKELVAAAYPALVPPLAAAAPAPNVITVEAFWWGFHFVVPEPVMGQWTAGGVTLAGVVAAIAPNTGPAAPFVAAGAAYIAAEVGLMKTVDHGKGVYVSMTWFAPGIFVPTSI